MSTDACPHASMRRRYVGQDAQQGRFADVHVESCDACGGRWLHYFFEIEGLSRSGRWFRGSLAPDEADRVTAETAAGLLESLPSYECGGSYFGGHVAKRSGPLRIT